MPISAGCQRFDGKGVSAQYCIEVVKVVTKTGIERNSSNGDMVLVTTKRRLLLTSVVFLKKEENVNFLNETRSKNLTAILIIHSKM